MTQSKIGLRNHLDPSKSKRRVYHKWSELLKFNIGASKMAEETEMSSFSIIIETSDKDVHLQLNKSDAKKMIDFFADKL